MPPHRRYHKKEKLDIKVLAKLFRYAKKYLVAIILATVFAIGAAVCSIVGPHMISDMVTIIQKGVFFPMDIDGVARIGITMLSIYFVGAAINYINHFITATVTQKMAKSLRGEIAVKINRIPLNYFDTTTKGDFYRP